MSDEKRVTSTGLGEIHKQTALEKAAGRFFKTDMSTIWDKIVDEAIIPSVKRVISDIVDTVLYGERRSSSSLSSLGIGAGRIGTMISYNSMFDGGKKKEKIQAIPEVSIGQVIAANKGEAEKCILQMMEIQSKYGAAKIGDLYDFFGDAAPSSYNNYGWRDFGAAKTKELDDGRCLIIPPMIELLQTN